MHPLPVQIKSKDFYSVLSSNEDPCLVKKKILICLDCLGGARRMNTDGLTKTSLSSNFTIGLVPFTGSADASG